MKHFTKKLALLTLLAGLCGSAWADNVYNIVYGVPTYDSDETTIIGVTPQTDFTSADGNTASDVTSSDANGSNCTNAMPIGGSVLYSSASFSKLFKNADSEVSPATKGTVHFEANYTATTNGQETWKIVDSNGVEIFGTTDAGWSNGNASRTWGFCNGVSLGTNWFRQARGGHNRVVLDINLSTKKVSYTVLVSSGNNSYSTLTGTYNLPEGVSDVAGLTATKQNYYSYMDNVSLYNVYDNTVSEYNYTINYQLGDETVATTTGKAEADAVVTAELPFTKDDIKYYAAEGATTSFTVTSTESNNVFNVAIRVANNYTYSINAVDENQNLLKVLSSGTVVEGTAVNYGYSQYVAKDGVLYTTAKQNSNPWWGKSFTPQADGETVTITYTPEGTTGVVFCEEAENISTLTPVTGGNTDIRASNRAGGYAASDALITTLPAGKYKVAGATYGNNGTTFTVKAGEEIVLTITTTGNPVLTEGEEFVLTEETEIIAPQAGNGGDSPKSIDYLYIVKTGDYDPSSSVTLNIGTIGYATLYYSDRALVVPAGVEAYTYTVTEGGAAYSTIYSEGEVIPAGEAVVIYMQGGGEAIFEVSSENPDKSIDNMLKGYDTPHLTEGGDYYYALSINAAWDESTIGFYWMEENGEAFESGAHKAYLALDKTFAEINGGSVKSFYGFGNSTTAIQGIDMNASMKDAVIYNLAGQRVSAPVKGNMYIVNGKKIMTK